MLITELRKMLNAKDITVKELYDTYIRHTEEHDSDINSYICLNQSISMSDAGASAQGARVPGTQTQGASAQGARVPGTQALEARAAAARDTSSYTLEGIPLALSDNICTKDMPTTCASRMLAGYNSPFEATVAARLSAAGALFTGKLNLGEFGIGGSADTSYYNGVKNPHDTAAVLNGAMGGAAAAVSAGFCAGALATDTGGSSILSAASCGVTGFVPTFGLVSRHGITAFSSSFDRVSLIANSAEDCAALLDAVSGEDSFDKMTRGAVKTDYASQMTAADTTGATNATDATPAAGAARATQAAQTLHGLRVGIVREQLYSDEVKSGVRDMILNAARSMSDAGALVSEVSVPLLKYAASALYIISCAETFANLARFDGIRFGHRACAASDYKEIIAKSRAEGFGNETKLRILFGAFALGRDSYDAYYRKAVSVAAATRAQYDEVFNGYDVLISPPAAVGASIAGLPAVTAPCGYLNGLPVGLVFTGKRFDDASVLFTAAAFESGFTRAASPLGDMLNGKLCKMLGNELGGRQPIPDSNTRTSSKTSV